MSSNLEQPEPVYDGALVAVAVGALRCFGDDLDRETAATLLQMWRFKALLSEHEVTAVLGRFTPATPRTAVCQRCGLTTPLVAGRFVNHADAAGEHCGDSGRPVSTQID